MRVAVTQFWFVGVAALSISLMLGAVPVEARDTKTVRVNPFARPLVVAPAPVVRLGATRSVASPSQEVPQLRGVLQAGANSFANVGGTIVGLGESVANMTLHSVTEATAVFLRNGKKVILEVSSTLDEAVSQSEAPQQTQELAGQDDPESERRDNATSGRKALNAINVSDIEKDKRSASRG